MESTTSPAGRRYHHRGMSDFSTQTSPRKAPQAAGISPSKKLPPLNEAGILSVPLMGVNQRGQISKPIDDVQWCGRFTGLNDKLKNEDPELPQSVRISAVFRKLEALCVGDEAVKSLKRFEDRYYVFQEKLKADRLATTRHSRSGSNYSVDTISAVAVHCAQENNSNGHKSGNNDRTSVGSTIPAPANPSLNEIGTSQTEQLTTMSSYKPYRPGLCEFPSDHDTALKDPRKAPSGGSLTPDSAASVTTVVGPDREADLHSRPLSQEKSSHHQQIQPTKGYQLSSSPTMKKLEQFSPHQLLQPPETTCQLSSSPGAKQLEEFSPIPTPARDNTIAGRGWKGEGTSSVKSMHNEMFLPTNTSQPAIRKATRGSGLTSSSVTKYGSPNEKVQRRHVSSPLANYVQNQSSSIPRPSGSGGKTNVPVEVGRRIFSDPMRTQPAYFRDTKSSMSRSLQPTSGNGKAAISGSQFHTRLQTGKYEGPPGRNSTPTGEVNSSGVSEKDNVKEGNTSAINAPRQHNVGRRLSSLPRWSGASSKSPSQSPADTLPGIPESEVSPQPDTIDSTESQKFLTPQKIQTSSSPLSEYPWGLCVDHSPGSPSYRVKTSRSTTMSMISSSGGSGVQFDIRRSKNISKIIFSREDSDLTMGSAATGSSADVNSPARNAEGGVTLTAGAAKVVNISREVSFGITVESENNVSGITREDSGTSVISSYTVLSTTTIEDNENSPLTGGKGGEKKVLGGMLGAGDNKRVVEKMVKQGEKALRDVMEGFEEIGVVDKREDEKESKAKAEGMKRLSGIIKPGQIYQKQHQQQGNVRPGGGPRLLGEQNKASLGEVKSVDSAKNAEGTDAGLTAKVILGGRNGDRKDTLNNAQPDSNSAPGVRKGNVQNMRNAYAKRIQGQVNNSSDSPASVNSKASGSTSNTGSSIGKRGVRPVLKENVAPVRPINRSRTRNLGARMKDTSPGVTMRKAVVIGTNRGLPEIHIGDADDDKMGANTIDKKLDEMTQQACTDKKSLFSEDLRGNTEANEKVTTINSNLLHVAPNGTSGDPKKNVLADITSIGAAKNARTAGGRNWLGQRKSPLSTTSRSISPPLAGSFVHRDRTALKENIPPVDYAVTNETQKKLFESNGGAGKTDRDRITPKERKGFTGWLKGASPRLSGEIFHKVSKKGKNSVPVPTAATETLKGKEVAREPEFSKEDIEALYSRLSAHFPQTPDEKNSFTAVGGRYYSVDTPDLESSPTKADRERNPIAVCMELISISGREPDDSPRKEFLLQMSRVLVDAVTKSSAAVCAAEEAKMAATRADCAAAETRQCLLVFTEIVAKEKLTTA
ncbi:hypothetical protein RUND412_001800 [Rhizina undulata]